MIRRMKTIGWLLAVVGVVCLISYPVQEVKDAWQTWSSPLSGKVVVLDPGHGAPDGGAVGRNGTEEKDITLELSQYLRDYLQEAGAIVYLTRDDDNDLSSDEGSLSRRKAEDIRKRVDFIKSKKADLFLSLHLNAIPSEKWRGAQTFYNPKSDKSESLAKFIQSEIETNLENTTRKSMGLTNIYLLKHTKAPGALVEAGFLSNQEERTLLESEEYQRKMAASVYRGILRYVTELEYPEDSEE
ncbi:N-acetylmuramoyl-L-alanine amidase CwlD [Halobacillus shinanisalinarum]|uniref:N-acetylmuramoyl-L-alanine amidase CwlD n=1 Tax=Halobacillus shinanisalinarum TaxID=2932258 RepID=A0ABY4GU52_9BACI|nr:N-acetylmuramoyl-L-alanine amidase CwlD [Halobacillus shinanisalinarum]UOQ91554.1 N-acetylmuramoyl-L-alanine amidase CwlD [Halobacillus shinanisalinarum]